MKFGKWSVVFIVFSLICLIGTISIILFQTSKVSGQPNVKKNHALNKNESINDKGFISTHFWETRFKGKKYRLSYKITSTKLDDSITADGQILSIFDESKNKLFEEKAVSFSDITYNNLLATESTQLIIKSINYGGSGNFLKILDYQNNQIVDLTKDIDTLYDGFAEIVPQFGAKRSPINHPYQILLTSPGLANPTHYTRVFNFRNGKYVYEGEYSRTDAETYVKAIINK